MNNYCADVFTLFKMDIVSLNVMS